MRFLKITSNPPDHTRKFQYLKTIPTPASVPQKISISKNNKYSKIILDNQNNQEYNEYSKQNTHFMEGYIMAWNRKKIIDFCNKEIFPQVHRSAWTHIGNELMDVVKMVSDFRHTNGYPSDMSARVDDGFLFINSIPVGRIARKLNHQVHVTDKGAYYEGRILARQEAYNV